MSLKVSLIAVCLVFATIALAKDKTPGGIKTYDEFPEVVQPWLKYSYIEEGKRKEVTALAAKAAISKAKGIAAKDAAKARYEELKKEFEAIRDVNNPPFVKMRIDACRYHLKPGYEVNERLINEVGFNRWEVGDIGTAIDEMKILRVIGQDSALMTREIGNFGSDGTATIVLKGFPTEGWTDGSKKRFSEALWASGTSVIGNSTYLVVEPFDWDRYSKVLQEKNGKIHEK